MASFSLISGSVSWFLIKNQVFICGFYGIYPPGNKFNDELTTQLRYSPFYHL